MDKIKDFAKAEIEYQDEGSDVAYYQVAPGPNSGISPTHVSRTFMSHFGFLGISILFLFYYYLALLWCREDVATSQQRAALVELSNKFERSLAQLDITAERVCLQ